MQFDLVDINLLVNIAESHSLTHGAERSNLSVPSASIRIKNIEDRLNVRLFYRGSHGVTLSPAGETFLHHGRTILRQLENLKGDLQEYAQGVKGHLRISASTTPTTEFLHAVLRTYLTTHPDVNVDLRERLSNDIVRAVSDGTADIGIVADSVPTGGLQVLPYRRYRLVLATALTHPLARHKIVAFEDTLKYDFISLVEASGLHAFLQMAAHNLHTPLKIRIQLGNFEALCRMIESNIGIGLLPELAARRHAKSMAIRIIRLSDTWAVRNLQICVRNLESLPAFARELVDLLSADANAAIQKRS
jgi:DNA-binding transcriptional LysR family regulator